MLEVVHAESLPIDRVLVSCNRSKNRTATVQLAADVLVSSVAGWQRRVMRIPLIVGVLLGLSACVYRPLTDDRLLTDSDAELLECERVAPTGTRLGKVTCLTAEEREALASEGRDQLERMQRSARGATKDPPR